MTYNATLREIIKNGRLDYSKIESEIEELEAMLGNQDPDTETTETTTTETKVAALNLIEDGAGDRYTDLLEILTDMDDAGIGPYDVLFTEDELEAGVQEIFNDETYRLPSWLTTGLKHLARLSQRKDNLKQDYSSGEVCGVTFYWRG